jgi:DNA-binding CsgD family transcriptional regulator/tetratricopeptide (TPR) repeat protein
VPIPKPELVGRDAELEAIDRFLSRKDDELPAALVIEGEAGIGKTVLWRATVERMRVAEATVLTSAPTLAEAQLAFAGLADLVEEVWDDVADELAGPQRTALEHALLLREGTHSPPDERGIAFGFLGLVRTLAQTRSLAIAIDDIQWLDPSSAAMLRFAVRRLRHEPVRFLLARRREEGADPDPLLLERTDGLAVESIAVGSLTLGALHRILRGRLGHPLTRRALTRINTASHGNPLHALELARAFESPSGDAPGSLPALMRARVLALPTHTRGILLLAALSADPSRTTLMKAGIHEPADALASAVEAELVTLDAGTVRFSHPLIATAVSETCDADEHQRCHSLLAEVAGTDEERARHLGRAATGADETIAAQLERAAELANRRGARAVSAELYEEAAALTPDGDETRRGRRLIEAGHAFFDVGDVERARALFSTLVDALPEGPERVEARWRLGTVLDETGESEHAARVWQDALELTGDRRLISELERSLAYSTVYIGNIPDAARHAAASVVAAEDGVDSRPLAYALAAQALIGVLGGSRDYGEILQRALSLDCDFDGSLGEWSPVAVAAECGRLTGEVEQTRAAYETVLTRAIDMGEASTELWAAFGLTSTELLAGRLDRASELAEIVLDLVDQTGLMRIPVTGLVGNVAAHTGDLDRARSLVVNALAEARATHEHMYELNLLHGLGFIESSSENHVAAAATFECARRIADELGARHITVLRASFYEAEAAGNAGLHGQAEEALATYGRAPVVPAWLESVRLRAIGVVAEARGDTTCARTMLEAALATPDLTAPVEMARTQLAYGSLLRRAREYSAARAQLERAQDAFGGFGAAAWLHQASEELARIPGRTRRTDGGLTDAEQRIAELVAIGSSNKEVAATLHLSVKTVEVTLTRVYRKLGVRSRSELAARFADSGSLARDR